MQNSSCSESNLDIPKKITLNGRSANVNSVKFFYLYGRFSRTFSSHSVHGQLQLFEKQFCASEAAAEGTKELMISTTSKLQDMRLPAKDSTGVNKELSKEIFCVVVYACKCNVCLLRCSYTYSTVDKSNPPQCML